MILFESIGHCHSLNIAHRDLKPENLLLADENNDSNIKIADFGFAKKVFTPNSLTTQCGTPGYVAPEILEGVPYDTKSDMWSLGVIIYILLGGYPPFIEQNQRELFRKIRKGQYEFHDEYWSAVSADAKDLISSLLTVDPNKRLSAEEAKKHKWMVKDGDVLAAQNLDTNLSELKKYNAKRKFKAAVNAVILTQKMASLGVDFKADLE
jgi:calcium/calmodulin-dependent protein kinase (CaM kinase) II/calcium/calmodulin-dependent protein kinase I